MLNAYLLSRVPVRGILTDAHNEITYTQIEALNSTFSSAIRSSMAAASKTEKASSEPFRGRASTTVEYGNGLERTRRHRAQGHRPPPDARTRTQAFNAPVAFPSNTLVTGSVMGNRHPSRHSFCSLPHQMTQGVSGREEPGWKGWASKVNALDSMALHGVQPLTGHVSFLRKGWASTNGTATTLTYQPR